MSKNKVLLSVSLVSMLIVAGSLLLTQQVNAEPEVTVYKSATCGCCNKWIKHMEDNGFSIKAVDVANMDLVKQHYGINRELGSCHTALVDGYIIEGHVPATDVKKLLSERPDVLGLTVPGMPIGSPGMEMGDHADHYDVLAVEKDGKTSVFSQY